MSSVRAQPDGAQLRVIKVRTHKSSQEKGAGKYFNEPHSIEKFDVRPVNENKWTTVLH